MDKIFKGEELEKERVREWNPSNDTSSTGSEGEGGLPQPIPLFKDKS